VGKEEFLTKIKPLVIEDMRETGILSSLTAAQAAVESAWGNSGLTQKANNLFGIKGDYNGQYVTMPTKEFVNGQYITVNAKFRKYPSWAESIADHSALFNRASRYTNLRGLTDYKLACKYVKDDGYATSPTYTQSLLKVIETYRLYTWDAEALGQTIDLPKTGNPYPEPIKLVKLNTRGNDVRWLQYALNEKGGYKLIIDGIAGPLTIGALKDYQEHHQDSQGHPLVVDGICGPKTREALTLK
jgi:hypothetical protein